MNHFIRHLHPLSNARGHLAACNPIKDSSVKMIIIVLTGGPIHHPKFDSFFLIKLNMLRYAEGNIPFISQRKRCQQVLNRTFTTCKA